MTGREDPLGEWVRARYERAYRTAALICGNPADAEEAVQDAFLRVWRFRDALPPDERARRVAVSGARQRVLFEASSRSAAPRPRTGAARARRRDDPVERVVTVERVGPVAERAAEHTAAAQALDSTLRDLPEALRVVVVLRYFSDLSEREIAIAIRRRPGTVKSRLHDARRRLAADVRLAAYAPDAEVTTR